MSVFQYVSCPFHFIVCLSFETVFHSEHIDGRFWTHAVLRGAYIVFNIYVMLILQGSVIVMLPESLLPQDIGLLLQYIFRYFQAGRIIFCISLFYVLRLFQWLRIFPSFIQLRGAVLSATMRSSYNSITRFSTVHNMTVLIPLPESLMTYLGSSPPCGKECARLRL